MRNLVVLGAFVASLTVAAVALARTPSQGALIDSTVRFLQESQDASGGFSQSGGEPSQGISGWAAQALASAGINPVDQARCGVDVNAYLVEHFREGFEDEIAWPQIATTAFERQLLVVDATGTDPHDVAGFDLPAEILARRLSDGSFPYVPNGKSGESNDTIFAILALAPLHEAAAEAAIGPAAEWVVAAQDDDGGWYYAGKSRSSEVDMTGAAIEALAVAGPPADEPGLAAYRAAIDDGLAYLQGAQLPDGGFPAEPTQEAESNVASTAWAVQAIWATGGNPETWTVGADAREPLDYMESMQQLDGHIRWRASSDLNGIWMTSYVTPAFAGQALPIPVAARFDPRASHGEAADCLKSGQGGESPQPGPGVLTGGGGHGAPAFSRPKRQSKGKTPGGARIVKEPEGGARNHSRTRRGANLRQPHGIERREPSRASEADLEVDAVSAASTPRSSGEEEVNTGALGGEPGGGDPGGGGTRPTDPVDAGAPEATDVSGSEEVSGVLVGASKGEGEELAFGAPGLRSAGAGSGEGSGLAIAIGAAALIAAALGAGLERLREALP